MIKEEKTFRPNHAAVDGQIWLAMDTATSSMTVALMRGEEQLALSSSRAERNHSIYLLPMVKQLLEQNGMKPRDLSGIAVGVGPGSYTGVRIAVTAAKTMAWALGCSVIGVSSLEAMALGGSLRVHPESKRAEEGRDGHRKTAIHGKTAVNWYVPLMDGRRGQAYTALFASARGEWSRLEEDAILLMASWLEKLKDRILSGETGAAADRGIDNEVPQEIWFVGEVESFQAQIEAFARACEGLNQIQVHTLSHDLSSGEIGRLAIQRLASGGKPDEVHGLLPNYTQLAEAEAKLLAKNKGGQDHGTRPAN
ncbi:tRNA (adenosine(37)-N6)-threonylcarbamoyltransferase complex dimerization subunit type 1 TsaB [Paenibacillus senegalensis]|uniref:tRNA (adenosine(37)-N6)-threonylcarbamoyltransferase complex dimerization subunit type 1 TsaB n=1 Tax=Paenibacillus senegalensis TaxID=1465766 RepID=UPI0002886A38|nr:tRNA (adenosine(37)-N6)-threonylcarbamoyltransferase complex dimerization subunit type 1 TsaB [Paenibacillus senegalensis]